MDELNCFKCQTHVGWITDSAPRGLVYCDDCKGQDDEENEPDRACQYCGEESCDCDML